MGLSGEHVSFAEVDAPLDLRADGERVRTVLHELTLVRRSGALVDVRVVLDLDAATYRRVDELALLHLEPEARGPGAARFSPAGRVRVEARLDPALHDDLVELGDDAAGIAHALADGSHARAEALLDAASWWAATVTAAVELPAELASSGELEEGFRTAWDDALPGGAAAADQAGGLPRLPWVAIVEDVLLGRGCAVEELPDPAVLGWAVADAAGAFDCFVVAREDAGILAVYAQPELAIPEDSVREAALLIAHLNFGMPIGGWELDVDEGLVRFKTSVDLGDEPPTAGLVERMVDLAVASARASLPALAAFASGEVDAAGAVALAHASR